MKIKDLCTEIKKTDSISKEEELEESILEIVRNYIKKKIEIKNFVGLEDEYYDRWPCNDYRNDTGSLTLTYISSENIHLNYKDYWSYGGRCDEDFVLSFQEIDEFNETNYKRLCQATKLSSLQHNIFAAQKELEKCQKELADFSEKIKS